MHTPRYANQMLYKTNAISQKSNKYLHMEMLRMKLSHIINSVSINETTYDVIGKI